MKKERCLATLFFGIANYVIHHFYLHKSVGASLATASVAVILYVIVTAIINKVMSK